MSLLDTLTGGETSESQTDLDQALKAIQSVQTPTAQSMEYQIQQLVQAGVLTPAQAKTFLQSPNALASENVDQTGTQAQESAISGLLSAADQGGLNPEEQAQMSQILQQLGTQEKGANDAVVQNQAARGALTGGETLAAQLENNQNATVNANQNAESTAGQAYQNMLSELSSAGSLGSGLQGQENTQADTVAAATNAINQFNAAQQETEENYNTQNTNEAKEANLTNAQNVENANVANENAYGEYQAQLPQEVYQDQMQKAGAEAGVNEQQANQATNAGQQEAGLIGGTIGAAGEAGASALAPAPVFDFAAPAAAAAAPIAAAHGGMIHDYLGGGKVQADRPGERAVVPGNSVKNDKIPAELSEGEIVLPRTISKNPQPDRVMAFLNRVRNGNKPPPAPIHPHDMKSVLDGLALRRNS